MHMQTIHLSLFAWMCSILMHTQCDMFWMKENLIKGYPKFICKIVFMGIAKTLLNVTGYANVICSKVWESAYQALHRGMIVSDCLPLGWLAIRPISIDGIHPSLSVGKITSNGMTFFLWQKSRWHDLHLFAPSTRNINSNLFSLWCISEYNGPEVVAVSVDLLELGCVLPLAGR